jgi:hypothetical protein
MPEDLWGDLPDVSGIRTPYAILVEQGELLARKTKGLLVGEVDRSPMSGEFRISFAISARSLSYSQIVLVVIHPISLYPLRVFNEADSGYYECRGESEFVRAVQDVFASRPVKNIIVGLLAQLNAVQ